jgi:hypothetical protein
MSKNCGSEPTLGEKPPVDVQVELNGHHNVIVVRVFFFCAGYDIKQFGPGFCSREVKQTTVLSLAHHAWPSGAKP